MVCGASINGSFMGGIAISSSTGDVYTYAKWRGAGAVLKNWVDLILVIQ